MERVSSLFPNSRSLTIFVCYIIFFVGQGIFVTTVQTKEGYSFNTVAVVFLTDAVKLVMAYLCYVKDNSLNSLWYGIKNNLRILCLYLIPSFLYCIYNNLSFVNLSHFDPTSYFILLQLRVVITGIIFQVVFNKRLTKIQWMSLVLLTCGCMLQQVEWDHVKNIFKAEEHFSADNSFFSVYLIFILIQTLCSCFAGVYNEHLLKEAGAHVNIFIQNIFMYIDSLFWNFLVLTMQGNVLSTFSTGFFHLIVQPLVLVVIMNNALIGIISSLFLHSLNSILKTFASAIEISLTAILSWALFGIEIKPNTILAIFIVFCSLYIYSKNPVASKSKVNSEILETEKKTSKLEEV